jgi:hypothetical protein
LADAHAGTVEFVHLDEAKDKPSTVIYSKTQSPTAAYDTHTYSKPALKRGGKKVFKAVSKKFLEPETTKTIMRAGKKIFATPKVQFKEVTLDKSSGKKEEPLFRGGKMYYPSVNKNTNTTDSKITVTKPTTINTKTYSSASVITASQKATIVKAKIEDMVATPKI